MVRCENLGVSLHSMSCDRVMLVFAVVLVTFSLTLDHDHHNGHHGLACVSMVAYSLTLEHGLHHRDHGLDRVSLVLLSVTPDHADNDCNHRLDCVALVPISVIVDHGHHHRNHGHYQRRDGHHRLDKGDLDDVPFAFSCVRNLPMSPLVLRNAAVHFVQVWPVWPEIFLSRCSMTSLSLCLP